MKVCKAVQGIMEDAKLEGKLEARKETVGIMITTLQELGQSSEFIIKTIMDKFELSEEEVKEYIK